jgi:hypothetical protein
VRIKFGCGLDSRIYGNRRYEDWRAPVRFRAGARVFVFFVASKTGFGAHSFTGGGAISLGVKRVRFEADQSHPSSAGVKNSGAVSSLPPIYMAWSPIKRRDNFTIFHIIIGTIRVPGYTTEMYCVSCEVRTEFIYVM